MPEAKYNDWFKGWVAFRCGKACRTKSGAVKVFATESAALRAAKRSTMGMCIR